MSSQLSLVQRWLDGGRGALWAIRDPAGGEEPDRHEERQHGQRRIRNCPAASVSSTALALPVEEPAGASALIATPHRSRSPNPAVRSTSMVGRRCKRGLIPDG
jgi:hypothetical protein